MDKEEEVYWNICSMTALNKQLKKITTIAEVKGSSSSLPKSQGQEEEAARKTKEETAHRLAEGARNILAEEAHREKEEEATRKKERRGYPGEYYKVRKSNSLGSSKSKVGDARSRKAFRRTSK